MFLRIIISQALHRWAVTLLLLIGMTSVVSLYVYLNNSARFSNRSMQLIMKHLGHNLIILPKAANPVEFHSCGDEQMTFSETECQQMADDLKLASKYYVNVLQQRAAVNDVELIVTGFRPVNRSDSTAEKGNLLKRIPADQARLGPDAARLLNVGKGDSITIKDRSFTVTRIKQPNGTIDDCRVWIDLPVAQELFTQDGKVNGILSFLCMHGKDLKGILTLQNKQFAAAFPNYRIIPRMAILRGRWLARHTTNRYLHYLLGLVLAITVMLIVVTGLQEVAERKYEAGVMLSMGAGSLYIAGLYIAKILAIALSASVFGFFIGSWLSKGLLADVLVTNTRPVTFLWNQLPQTIILTCLVALLAEAVPLVKLLRMNPNAVLTEE